MAKSVGRRDRDDFPLPVKEALAKRASYICSNPDCRALTLFPSQQDPEGFLFKGVAAHISGASAGGPRYDASLSTKERQSIENSIFLCASCSIIIDKHEGADFSVDILRKWKSEHEEWVRSNLNKPLASQFAAENAEKQLKIQLILKMGSPDNATALNAARELEARGWLQDGSLQSKDFYKANLTQAGLKYADLRKADLALAILRAADLWGAKLSNANLIGAKLDKAELTLAELDNANLTGADLLGTWLVKANLNKADLFNADFTGAYLSEANLKDAEGLTDFQLAQANMLRRAIMVDGKQYDGRYSLAGDLQEARDESTSVDDPQAMAMFYGISTEEYQHGQDWAPENRASASTRSDQH